MDREREREGGRERERERDGEREGERERSYREHNTQCHGRPWHAPNNQYFTEQRQ